MTHPVDRSRQYQPIAAPRESIGVLSGFPVPGSLKDRKVGEAILEDLSTLQQMAAEAHGRLENLNLRVLGPVPEAPKDGNGRCSPSGFLSEIGSGLANLRDQLELIHSELARLESAL